METSCIDLDMFTAYFGNYISKEDRKMVEKHLAGCNKCLKLFTMTTEHLLDPDIYEYEPACESKGQALWKSIQHKIDRLIKWGHDCFPPKWTLPKSPSFQPIPVRVREEESAIDSQSKETQESFSKDESPIDFIHIKKECDPLMIEIYVEHTSENKICFKIRAHWNNQVPDDIFVYLKPKDKGPAAKPLVNEYVIFENLPYGSYQLIVEQNNKNKGLFEFEINHNGIVWLNS